MAGSNPEATITILISLIITVLVIAAMLVILFHAIKRFIDEHRDFDVERYLTEIQSALKFNTEMLMALKETQKTMFQAINDERISASKRESDLKAIMTDSLTTNILSMEERIGGSIDTKIDSMRTMLDDTLTKTNSLHKELLTTVGQMTADNKEAQIEMAKSLAESLEQIRRMNEQKLNEINSAMQETLDKSLNEKLDSSFKQVGDQLGDLYKSLGELHSLSTGVDSLNKTLSNVKSRGVFGEQQLAAILENTMTTAQYETNIATKKNSSDVVEFAIKIPSKGDDNDFVLLPIDSKFPTDIYNKIVAASEQADSKQLTAATKELEQRIKLEARTIRDKYINPPVTTDFAVMFLPTESLYSEVLRIDGLTEWCQTNCKIIISGPTTITALLNSLRVGFSNLTLNKKTQEVIKVLQAIKTQYGTLSDLIDKTQKKLADASTSTEALKQRTEMIRKRMGKIETIEPSDAEKILALTEE